MGVTVEVPELLGGVTGEIGELEPGGIQGVNPVDDGVETALVAAKAVRARASS